MSISGIGVQRILSRKGAGWQAPNPSRSQSDEAESDQASADRPERKPPEPEPGTGRIVDRKA